MHDDERRCLDLLAHMLADEACAAAFWRDEHALDALDDHRRRIAKAIRDHWQTAAPSSTWSNAAPLSRQRFASWLQSHAVYRLEAAAAEADFDRVASWQPTDRNWRRVLEDVKADLLARSLAKAQVVLLPPMPEIGHIEGYYARQVFLADKAGNSHAHEAAKVGQYITLARSSSLSWERKLRYFEHALRRHCVAPPLASEEVWLFYAQLANLTRQYAGLEALRLASKEDDHYAIRLHRGEPRDTLAGEAEDFFDRLMGPRENCPSHFNKDDWDQLKLIRNQWVSVPVRG